MFAHRPAEACGVRDDGRGLAAADEQIKARIVQFRQMLELTQRFAQHGDAGSCSCSPDWPQPTMAAAPRGFGTSGRTKVTSFPFRDIAGGLTLLNYAALSLRR